MFGWRLWWCPTATIPTIPPQPLCALLGHSHLPPPPPLRVVGRHPTATVATIEDAPCCCGHHVVLMATVVVLVVASSLVHSSSSGPWVPPCCRRHPWCPAPLLSSPSVHGGSMWQWVPPCLSSWLCGPSLVIIMELVPPPTCPHYCGCLLTCRCGCVVSTIHPCGHGCLLAHPCGRVVPPQWSSWLCPPVIVVAMGAPACPHGHVVPPGHHHGHSRLSSWPCPPAHPRGLVVPWSSSSLWVPSRPWMSPHLSPGTPLGCWCSPVIVVAMSWPCGAPPAHPCGHVVPLGCHHDRHGCPRGCVVLPAHPHVEPPSRCHGRVVPHGHWCPPLLALVTVGALEAVGVLLLVPWWPAWLLVLPSHRGGCVVAMWCPPVVQVVWCPSCSSLWLCGVPPVIVMELVPPPRSSSLLWVPPTHPHGCQCIRAWCPPIGHGCGGHFVVMVVVKGQAVNRQDTYYIRMPPHDPADQSTPSLFV